MLVHTIFEVKGMHLDNFPEDQFVWFFRELLFAEARRIRLPINKINISERIDVSDGGIDASVEDADNVVSDLFVDTNTFYQIKAGKNFKPWQESEIKKELFGNKEPKEESLGEYVRKSFKNGTYVLVCGKVQLTPQQRNQAEGHIKKLAAACGYSGVKVQVWDQVKVIGSLHYFPSMSLQINGNGRAHFQTHKSWSKDREMTRPLEAEKPQLDFMETVEKLLRGSAEAVHISVFGETGVGKTRLIFEATNTEDIAPLVIYCDSPSKFTNSDLENDILRDDNQFEAILIIDECDEGNRSKIWNKLEKRGPRIRLITIYNDYESLENTKVIEAPKLSREGISKIIKQYYNDKIIADNIAGLCNGNPRLAHLFGIDLKNNPGQWSGSLDAESFWMRYISGGDDPQSEEVKRRKKILLTLSLFKKFGHGDVFPDEMKAIHGMVQNMDQSITLNAYIETIQLLKRRKILQGSDTLYINTKALHLKLWREYWETYGSIGLEEVPHLPPKLLEWFFDMFKYAQNAPAARKVAGQLLVPNGIFKDIVSLQTHFGNRLFSNLAKADPKSALGYLKRVIETLNTEELRKLEYERRAIIPALERIVWEEDLFDDGAELLLALAEAENEQWSNNATGIFTSLFSHAPGPVAMTKSPPKRRLDVLKKALCHKSKERRKIGLKAFGTALKTRNFLRSSGIDDDELMVDHYGWTPKSVQELIESYKSIIDLGLAKLSELSSDEQKEAIEIIFDNARGLLTDIPNLDTFVIEKMDLLAQHPAADKEKLLHNIINVIEYEKDDLTAQAMASLKELEQRLTGEGFSALMRRYVGMEINVDFARGKAEDVRGEKIKELAREAFDIEKLKPELKWLVSTEAKYGYSFGYELGKMDTSLSLLPILLDSQRQARENHSAFFLSGYFRAIFERDKEKWEYLIKSVAEDNGLQPYVMELSWRSGITDKIGLLILESAKAGRINPKEFAMFRYGGTINWLSEGIVEQWIQLLLTFKEREVVSITMDLFYTYFVHRQSKKLNKWLTLSILTNESFLGSSRETYMMDSYHWIETAKAFVKQYPDEGPKLADVIIQNLGRDSFFDYEERDMIPFLNEITKKAPKAVWEIAAKYIGPPLDSRAYHILNWIRGGFIESEKSIIDSIPINDILDWIENDKESRAPYMARFIPPLLKKENCLARELLVRYGEMDSVRKELVANFSTGFFSGSETKHYEDKKSKLLEYKKVEDNRKVRKWIDFYVNILDSDIGRSRITEEREF